MCFGLFSRSSSSDSNFSSSSGEVGNARPIDLHTLRRSISPRVVAHGHACTPQQAHQQVNTGRPTIRIVDNAHASDEAHQQESRA